MFAGNHAKALRTIRSAATPDETSSLDFALERQLIAWMEGDWRSVIRLGTNRSMGEKGYVDETEVLAYLASVHTGATPNPESLVGTHSRAPALAEAEDDSLCRRPARGDAREGSPRCCHWRTRLDVSEAMGCTHGVLPGGSTSRPWGLAGSRPFLERSVGTNLRDEWAYRLAQQELREESTRAADMERPVKLMRRFFGFFVCFPSFWSRSVSDREGVLDG